MTKSNMQLSATFDVSFNGPVALTHYSLELTNTGVFALEALYHFALPRCASLMECNVNMEGRTFSGQVLPRNNASDVHEEAVESGKRSVLLEAMNDGVYGLNMGNLDAGESVIIKMTIASLLTVTNNGKSYTYQLPTNLAPRYGQTGNDVEPEYRFSAQYPFTAALSLPSGAKVQTCSHTVSANTGNIDISGQLDRDIFISWQQEVDNHLYWAKYRDYSYTLGFPILPSTCENEAPSSSPSLHVLLDRSGSMSGESIALCKHALTKVIQGLKASVTFNFTSFGSEYHTLFTQALAMNTQNKSHCLDALKPMSADMGGTELISALLHTIFHNKACDSTTHLLMITDGHMHLDDEDVAAVQLACDRYKVQLHIIGVGYSVNTQALVRLSEAALGTLHIVNPNGELNQVVQNILHIIHSATLPVNLAFNSVGREEVLDKSLWSAVAPIWYAQLPQAVFAEGECVLIEGTTHQRWVPKPVEGKWAQALVQIAASQHLHRLDEDKATNVAIELGMLSRFTSFVMLDTTNDSVSSPAVPMVIPQMFPLDTPLFLRKGSSTLAVPSDVSYSSDSSSDASMEFFSLTSSGLSSVEDLGDALLNDIDRRWWRKSSWTREHLMALGFHGGRIDEFDRLAAEEGVPLYIVAIAFVFAYIDAHTQAVNNEYASGSEALVLPERAERRLARLSKRVDDNVKRKVAAYYQHEQQETVHFNSENLVI